MSRAALRGCGQQIGTRTGRAHWPPPLLPRSGAVFKFLSSIFFFASRAVLFAAEMDYIGRMRSRPSSASPADQPDGADTGRTSFVISGHTLRAPKLPAGLYLVATPIGNLGDITIRALETLAAADLIACEDTRITRRLTERFDISTPLTPYHEHNAATARPKLLARLEEGAVVALVSDAGTPLVSDPGFKLVREAAAAGIHVTSLPGPSSVLAALTLAGLPPDRFYFEGFLPPKSAARRARMAELAAIDATLVMFEAGTRVQATLRELAEIFGPREAAICRELTKLHETVLRGPLADLAQNADALETRGEFVLVVAPPPASEQIMGWTDIDALLREALRDHSVKDAVAQAVDLTGRPRRDVYARALQLARETDADDDDGT